MAWFFRPDHDGLASYTALPGAQRFAALAPRVQRVIGLLFCSWSRAWC
jgi:hypothetical protein